MMDIMFCIVDFLWLGGIGGGDGWKLPDKLRIVKPLEGSLTLHNWQQLALPSLGGIFEERRGIAFRGGLHHLPETDQQDIIHVGKNCRTNFEKGQLEFGQRTLYLSTFYISCKYSRKRHV